MADQSERHNPPHGATVRPFARPSTGADATPAPGAATRPAPYVSPGGASTGDQDDRDGAPWPARGPAAAEAPSIDPADSDAAAEALAPEQGADPVAEGAPGDDPDAGLGMPATDETAPLVMWATPMGTPPVYPATEELEQSLPEQPEGAGSWPDEQSIAAEARAFDATPIGGDAPTGEDPAEGRPVSVVDHSPSAGATGTRPRADVQAEVLERLALRLRTGAPIVERAAARQEAAVLARLLAELLAVDDAGSSSRQAPSGPAGVEL